MDTRPVMRYRCPMPTIDRPKAQREDVLAYWRKNPEKNAVEVCAHFAKKRQALTPEQCRAWKSRHGIGPRDDAPSVAPGGKGDALVPEVLPRGSASGGVTGSRDVQGCGGVSPPERGPGVRGEVTVAPRARGDLAGAETAYLERGGRPSVLTGKVAAVIVQAISVGLPMETACGLAEVSDSSGALWMEKGAAGDPVYSEFYARVKVADAQAQQLLWSAVEDPKWKLAKRWPHLYAESAAVAAPTIAVQVNFGADGSVEALSGAVSADAERRRKG